MKGADTSTPVAIDSNTQVRSREFPLIACALVSVAVFIGVGMGRSVWLDEANSILIARHSFSGIVDGLSRDNNLPLYYLILSLWMRVLGDSETALRLLSAVFYLGGCAAVFALAARLTSQSRAAWFSAFFYESRALAIRQAQNIRMYSLLGLFSAFSAWCWLRVFRDRDNSPGAWFWFLAVNASGLLTHVWFVFVLAGQFVAVAVLERKQLERFLLGCVAAAAPFCLLWGRIFWGQLHNGATDWMPHFIPVFFIIALTDFYGRAGSLLVFGLIVIAVANLDLRGHRWLAPLALMFGVSLVAPLIVSVVKPIYWPGRYMIIALPALAVMLGSLLANVPLRFVAVFAAFLFLTFQLYTHVAERELVPEANLPPGQSDRTTAQFVLAHAAAGDAVLFASLTRAPADYYFLRADASARFQEFTFPASTASHMGWLDHAPASDPLRQTESAALAERLKTIATSGHTVWVYSASSPEAARLLQGLDSVLELRSAHPLSGPYHERLLEYHAAH
jgi:hypothetical protein